MISRDMLKIDTDLPSMVAPVDIEFIVLQGHGQVVIARIVINSGVVLKREAGRKRRIRYSGVELL
jgi:hypothetical protein